MDSFGTLKRLNLRKLWPHEASNFTPWLAENIEELGKTLGMELELELKRREADVGDFSLDLLATDLGTNRTVVIENQLTQTDHDHLGKLITYASGFDASVVIWLSESIREEHRQGLEWLNQRTDSDTEFFGVVIEVLQIDDSKPAYHFKPIVFPNEWKKSKRRPGTGQVSEKMEAYRLYFQELLDILREKHKFTNARKGQPQSWYTFSSGHSGIYYGACFALGSRARVELYIDQGDSEKNKTLFDLLFQEKVNIESELGNELEWERLDDKRSSRVALYTPGTIDSSDETKKQLQTWMSEYLLNFKAVFNNRLQKLLSEINKS